MKIEKRFGAMANSASIVFQITESCNLNCSYCYQHFKSPRTLDLNTAVKECQEIIRLLEQENGILGKNNVKELTISFIGGEPFLHPEIMDMIIQMLMSGISIVRPDLLPFVRFSLNTNGTLLQREDIKNFILKYEDILNIALSLDGVKELHDKNRINQKGEGSFDKAFKNGLWLKKHGLDHIKMTFSKEDINYIAPSLKFFLENGFKHIVSTPIYEDIYTEKDAQQVYKQFKEIGQYVISNKIWDEKISILNEYPRQVLDFSNYPCEIFGDSFCFSVDGKAYPCCRFASTSLNDNCINYSIGDCEKGIFNSNDVLSREKLKEMTIDTWIDDECLNCLISGGCGWCPAYCAELGQFGKRTKGNCWFHRAKILALYNYKNQRSIILGDCQPEPIKIPEEIALKIISQEEYDTLKEQYRKAKIAQASRDK